MTETKPSPTTPERMSDEELKTFRSRGVIVWHEAYKELLAEIDRARSSEADLLKRLEARDAYLRRIGTALDGAEARGTGPDGPSFAEMVTHLRRRLEAALDALREARAELEAHFGGPQDMDENELGLLQLIDDALGDGPYKSPASAPTTRGAPDHLRACNGPCAPGCPARAALLAYAPAPAAPQVAPGIYEQIEREAREFVAHADAPTRWIRPAGGAVNPRASTTVRSGSALASPRPPRPLRSPGRRSRDSRASTSPPMRPTETRRAMSDEGGVFLCGGPLRVGEVKRDQPSPKNCPKCGGAIESGYGLAGGGIGTYWYCVGSDDCDWEAKRLDDGASPLPASGGGKETT